MTLSFAQPSLPEMYERYLVQPLFRPFAEVLLDAVGLASRERVLDIACGTGAVSRLAHERLNGTGVVVGVDVSPQMLGIARRFSGIDWREGDASALPLADGEQFDIVTCHQGMQFFPDRPSAIREMHRALTEDGRLAVGVWCSDDEVPFMRELRGVAEKHVGPINDRRHGFGDARLLEGLLRDGGFRDVRSRKVSRLIRFADPGVIVRLNTMALVGMSGAKDLADEERTRVVDQIIEDSGDVARRYTDGGAIAFDLTANIATARR